MGPDDEESPEHYWDDPEEFERDQVAHDLEHENIDDGTPLGLEIEEEGDMLDE